MKPTLIGDGYNKLARWWHEQHHDSSYGVNQVKRALQYCQTGGNALDVGCGAGGRMVRLMQKKELAITGIDVSPEMIKLAIENHPDENFLIDDICHYQAKEKYNFILAWDSIFHLPLSEQEPVVTKLCKLLAKDGVLIYTFGDAVGEHDDQMKGGTFHYSSIGINGNLALLAMHGVTCKHLEVDQWPQSHVYCIGVKT